MFCLSLEDVLLREEDGLHEVQGLWGEVQSFAVYYLQVGVAQVDLCLRDREDLALLDSLILLHHLLLDFPFLFFVALEELLQPHGL